VEHRGSRPLNQTINFRLWDESPASDMDKPDLPFGGQIVDARSRNADRTASVIDATRPWPGSRDFMGCRDFMGYCHL
jgi:hypothetical protein